MTNQELAQKLSSLKNVSADKTWLDQNRVLLLAQISNSGAETLPTWRVALINFSSFTRAAARPATAFGVFCLMLLMGGVYSQQIFAQVQPNDSLYIARLLSERVRLSATFNADARDKLAVQYAANRVQDISAVLADPEFNKEENKDRIAELNDNFKTEVETVKQGIVRLNAKTASNKVVTPASPIKTEDNLEVVIADSNKDDNGIQVSEGASLVNTNIATVSTSSLKTKVSSEATTEISIEADNMLEEAKQLFEAKDYEKASEKIQKVNEMINN